MGVGRAGLACCSRDPIQGQLGRSEVLGKRLCGCGVRGSLAAACAVL